MQRTAHRLGPILVLLALTPVLCAQERGAGRGGRGFSRPDPVKEALDADGDGELSAAEVAAAPTALAGLDRNGDGNLTTDELTPPEQGGRRRGFPGPGGMAGPVLRALDLDGDAELFEDEVTDAALALARLDADGDGRLAGEELGGGEGMFPGRGRGGFDRGGDGPTETLEPDELDFEDGVARIPDRETFKRLSYLGDEVLIDVGLKGIEFVKFTITGAGTADAKIYFINTRTHRAHRMFGSAVGLPRGFGGRGGDSGQMKGVLSYRPLSNSPSGNPGLYTFEFEPFDSYPYERIRVAFDLLREFAPILDGNLAYYPLPAALDRYEEEEDQYASGNLPAFFPENLYDDIGFLPLHRAVGFGRLRLMELGERPGARDVVVYPTLPNELPRVAGVLTGVRQTPLSHVNLRASQDDVPNAFVRGAANLPAVQALLGKYVRYEVRADGFDLREASSDEVEAHFAELRPAAPQEPRRDLSVTDIRSLDDVGFADAPSIGVKSANLAALRKIGLPGGTVPAGLAVPFSCYDSFMRENGLHAMAAEMMAEPGFRSDASIREAALREFRKALKKGTLSEPLMSALGAAQSSFAGASIRCRSSTNNEDLPGFSGAGLYDSFTHHPDEGHLEKSIKQVYASLWNLRAFDEREFFRIDHMTTAMGVLLHTSVPDEAANGVAVTEDIVYQTAGQGPLLYYVNAQVGESLVTNPDPSAIPEEILLAPRNPRSDRLVQASNLVEPGTRILSDAHLLELRRHLRRIHAEFLKLYTVPDDQPFAMEVEFKVLRGGQLSIKQARPWVY